MLLNALMYFLIGFVGTQIAFVVRDSFGKEYTFQQVTGWVYFVATMVLMLLVASKLSQIK